VWPCSKLGSGWSLHIPPHFCWSILEDLSSLMRTDDCSDETKRAEQPLWLGLNVLLPTFSQLLDKPEGRIPLAKPIPAPTIINNYFWIKKGFKTDLVIVCPVSNCWIGSLVAVVIVTPVSPILAV